MFKYGLYLLDKGNDFRSNLIPVEGFLLLPHTKIIAIWGEIKWNDEVLTEVIPYKHEDFKIEYADELIRIIIKRFRERIELINALQCLQKEEGEKKYENSQRISSKFSESE